jgi:signal transduction histidine kinase
LSGIAGLLTDWNFVSAVTHELKTPLTAIRLYAEMLRDGLVPSES